MKNVVLFFLVSLSFLACTPEPAPAPTLTGTWTSTARTKNGNNDLISGDTWTFNACADPTTGTCSGNYSVPYLFTTLTSNFTYRIHNNGSKLDMDFSNSSLVFQDISDADIVTHTATTINITFTDSNGDYYDHTLTKQ
ncbi:hypothetical protein [Aureispira anguillae]|uniref:Lipocalin-like domain-containing protein n=1 Tax=Aureispira anguillae TaxID=2864201 RepID=A0A916DRM3_9BACT|nr:hypothetical protein [Aureispira anguillae]BDS10301.1 hypothetical protein AsAng_0010090 [Aureispira anguillae]